MYSLLPLLFYPLREFKRQISINFRGCRSVTSLFTPRVFRLPEVPPFYAVLLLSSICLPLSLSVPTVTSITTFFACWQANPIKSEVQANEDGQMFQQIYFISVMGAWIQRQCEAFSVPVFPFSSPTIDISVFSYPTAFITLRHPHHQSFHHTLYPPPQKSRAQRPCLTSG